MDLLITHHSYLEIEHYRDPAETDPELNAKLKHNKTLAQKKINEICDLYVHFI